ncbi:MAG TPA: hypothetical protein PKY59_19790 [Pyrinomonadaceae bacterium]|nr:hypothetical protein [Pyrinomonadaceae bacterium]
MKKSCFTIALTILVSCFLVVSAEAQSKTKDKTKEKTSDKVKVAKEGVGIDGIRVGKSTTADVIKKYGKSYQTKKYGKYSQAVIYPKLGLAFYSCQADKKNEVFDIEMRAPFQVKTAKGIVLGKSTLEDIQKVYGKKKDGLEYKGVSFFYANYKGKKTVTVIDIVENSGIRQCKEVQ